MAYSWVEFFRDDFNRPDQNPIGAPWVQGAYAVQLLNQLPCNTITGDLCKANLSNNVNYHGIYRKLRMVNQYNPYGYLGNVHYWISGLSDAVGPFLTLDYYKKPTLNVNGIFIQSAVAVAVGDTFSFEYYPDGEFGRFSYKNEVSLDELHIYPTEQINMSGYVAIGIQQGGSNPFAICSNFQILEWLSDGGNLHHRRIGREVNGVKGSKIW